MSKEFSFLKEFSVQDEDLKVKLLFPFQHAQKAFTFFRGHFAWFREVKMDKDALKNAF